MRKLFPVGTRTLLFGVHQVLWHPWTVAKAFRLISGKWPTLDEWICIFFHDWGYWGLGSLDGPDGKCHPVRGSNIARALVTWRHRYLRRAPRTYAHFKGVQAGLWTAMHSSGYAALLGCKPSGLYLPDKASILCEPRWFYLLRARLSGELREFVANSPKAGKPAKIWYEWYCGRVEQKVRKHFNLT